MSDKTSIILTFIASVLLPFVRDLVDMIDSLKGNFTANVSNISDEIANVAQPKQKPTAKATGYNPYACNAADESPFSRFLSKSKK